MAENMAENLILEFSELVWSKIKDLICFFLLGLFLFVCLLFPPFNICY